MPIQSVAIADIIYRGPWYRNRGIALLNISLCLAILTSSINGFDSSVLNGLQIVPDWQAYFGFPEPSALGLMNAAQNIGALIALPFAPFLSDGIGRRMTIFVGSLFMLGGVTLQALAGNITHFIASRALIGFGLCFAANASPLLISELAYPTHRGKITAMYNSSWYLGSILSAWVTVGTLHGLNGTTWSWRIPSIIQAVPSLMQALFVWFIPESPRWLIAKGKDREAIRVLGQYHANGNERDPLVGFTYSQIREALSIEKDIARSTSYLSLFATPGNRKRMRIIIGIAMFSQWSGNGLVSFYIHLVLNAVGITDPSTETIINGSLQIWNFIMAISAALLVDRVGRRPLFITSNAGMLLTFSMWTLTTALYVTRDDTRAAHATIGLIAVFFSFYDIAYTPMLVAYTVEILPYNIRAKGFAVMNFTVCLCLAFNQFINPLALDGISWYYYLFYVGFLTFELIFIWAFLVETKGKTLEETAALFDGESYADNLQNIGHEAATQSHHIFQTAGFENKSDEVEMESRYPDDGDSRRYSALTDNSPAVRHR